MSFHHPEPSPTASDPSISLLPSPSISPTSSPMHSPSMYQRGGAFSGLQPTPQPKAMELKPLGDPWPHRSHPATATILGRGPAWERNKTAEEITVARIRHAQHVQKNKFGRLSGTPGVHSPLEIPPAKLPDIPISVKERNNNVKSRTHSPNRKTGEVSPRIRGKVKGEMFKRMPGWVLVDLLRKQLAANEENVLNLGGGGSSVASGDYYESSGSGRSPSGGSHSQSRSQGSSSLRGRSNPPPPPPLPRRNNSPQRAPVRAASQSPGRVSRNQSSPNRDRSPITPGKQKQSVRFSAIDEDKIAISEAEWLYLERKKEADAYTLVALHHRKNNLIPDQNLDGSPVSNPSYSQGGDLMAKHRQSNIETHLGVDAANSLLLTQKLVVIDCRSVDARTRAHLIGSRSAPDIHTGRYPEFLRLLRNAQFHRSGIQDPILVVVHDAETWGAPLASQLVEQGWKNVHFTIFQEAVHAGPDLIQRAPLLERWEEGWE